MNLCLQPTPETCGQACIAMIVGKSVEEVMRDMKMSGPTQGILTGRCCSTANITTPSSV